MTPRDVIPTIVFLLPRYPIRRTLLWMRGLPGRAGEWVVSQADKVVCRSAGGEDD